MWYRTGGWPKAGVSLRVKPRGFTRCLFQPSITLSVSPHSAVAAQASAFLKRTGHTRLRVELGLRRLPAWGVLIPFRLRLTTWATSRVSRVEKSGPMGPRLYEKIAAELVATTLQQLENSIVGDSSLYLRAVAGWRNRDRMTIRSVTAIPTAPPSTDCSSDGSEHVGAVRLNRTECTLIGSSFP